MSPTSLRRLTTVVAVLGPVALAAVLVPWRSGSAGAAFSLLMVVPVVLAAAVGGLWAGAVAAVTAALSYDFFLTRPYGSLKIDTRADLVTTVALLVVGLVVGAVARRRDLALRIAASREDDLTSLRRVAGIGSATEDPGWLIEAACREVGGLLHADQVDFEPGPAPPELPTLGHGNLVVRSGRGNGEALATVAVPIEHVGTPYGHFVVHLPTPRALLSVPPDRRAQCSAVADLLGAAISRAPRPSFN